jgi:hypothetical protein
MGSARGSEVWNIFGPYLRETGTYLDVSTRNIPQFGWYNSFYIRWLGAFRTRTESPRVGGSIPPLATIQINIANQEVASERIDFLSNTCAGVQYFGPLFA